MKVWTATRDHHHRQQLQPAAAAPAAALPDITGELSLHSGKTPQLRFRRYLSDMTSLNGAHDKGPSSTSSKPKSYQQATGRFKLVCTFEAIFSGDKEQDIKTCKILKTLVANARSKRNPKFQTVKLENPKIHQYVTANDAAVDVLKLIGFVENQDLTSGDNKRSLLYNPDGMQQLQEGSRLMTLLDEKLVKLQKVDTSTTTVKQHKASAVQKKQQEEEARKNNLAMFQEDRERQKERQEREKRLAELDAQVAVEAADLTEVE